MIPYTSNLYPGADQRTKVTRQTLGNERIAGYTQGTRVEVREGWTMPIFLKRDLRDHWTGNPVPR